MLRYLTSGESHGKGLTAILEGMPSGLSIASSDIDLELVRRQSGWGRGGRMKIEKDRVEITSGVRWGKTLGSPIGFLIQNRDWENWEDVMSPLLPAAAVEGKAVTRPRPGHADLPGGLKYDHRDLRNILERSSARETAARVAVGAAAKRFLEEFGIRVLSWVIAIGGVGWKPDMKDPETLFEKAEKSLLRCPDKSVTERMKRRIDETKAAGDSLGGVFEVAVTGAPPGLGSHVQWDRKLDGRLAQTLMSIQAIKGVEVGMGFLAGTLPGSRVHDEIFYKGNGRTNGKNLRNWLWPTLPRFYRRTNNAGGIEGGMTNGETVLLRAVMKPIPTLYRPLRSVDIETKKSFKASVERSDICAVPAAAVVAEAAIAFELARAFLEKFGGDSIREITRNYRGYIDQIRKF